MKSVGLPPEWALYSDLWRDLKLGKHLILA